MSEEPTANRPITAELGHLKSSDYLIVGGDKILAGVITIEKDTKWLQLFIDHINAFDPTRPVYDPDTVEKLLDELEDSPDFNGHAYRCSAPPRCTCGWDKIKAIIAKLRGKPCQAK